MGKKKGLSMPTDVGMTLVLVILAMIMIIVLVLTNIRLNLPVLSSGSQVAYSIDFVSIANRPFMLAEVLSRIQLGDRTLLEQATESAAVETLEGAAATELPGRITNLMRLYDLTNYHIIVSRGSNAILDVDNTEHKCGSNKEGWCVFGDCDVGRIEIAQGDNACVSKWAKCCKEDRAAYAATVRKHTIVSCAGDKGVCSEGVQPLDPGLYPVRLFETRPYCAQKRIDYGLSADCVGSNNGKTRVCCGPKTEQNDVDARTLTRATVPLLYKDLVYGTLEVTGR